METMEKDKKPYFKYCVVPMCKNTLRTAPDKLFFNVPRREDIRRVWCERMKREMISPSTPLYCCEDHFNIEEDTENYVEYKIMTVQMKEKKTLRLKKGILPHKFDCQEGPAQPPIRTKGYQKRKLEVIENDLSLPLDSGSSHTNISSQNKHLEPSTSTSSSHTLIHAQSIEKEIMFEDAGHSSLTGDASTTTYSSNTLIHSEDVGNLYSISTSHEASTSTSLSHTIIDDAEDLDNKHSCEACGNSSSSDTKYVDKAIQVKSKPHFRSKGVQVNITAKTRQVAVSPVATSTKTTSTSPLKMAQRSGFKRRLLQDNSDDIASVSSAQPSVSTSSFEPEISSPGSSSVTEYDSDSETQFKNQMRSCTLTAIEKEPKMLIGLPKKSYYLIKLLSETIPLHTADILITLKKIKLNESFSILALQFGYTQSTISRIFSKSIFLLAEKMKELIVWPTPSEIFKNLPISFRARYSKVVSIIDCLEIQIEKPTNAIHQSLTWSQYKKCNTLKYLISCTPDGLVNFISVGYGGRASDVAIVEDCGFLECLPANTAIMADRGFKDISHSLTKKDCILIRPPSVLKSVPSTKEEVKESKRIAALRIHVERVISRLREFHMLLPHACVDHNLIPVIDEVIVVACGLINMQDVIIKK